MAMMMKRDGLTVCKSCAAFGYYQIALLAFHLVLEIRMFTVQPNAT